MPLSADRVVLTSGTSEGIELALTALAEAGDEVLVPVPTYPLYTAVLAKIGARAVFYRTDPSRGWLPDLDHITSLITPATRALVSIDPNNPTGAVYPPAVRRALVDIADRHGIPLLADEVYADLAFDGPVNAIAAHNPDAPVITFSSLSKAYLAPGWRAGWMAVGRTERLDEVLAGVKKLADGRLCATGPMEYAITAALNGDRSHQEAFRAALRERADLTTARLNAIDGITVRAAQCRVLRDAEGRAAARRDRRRLRARPAACDRCPVRLWLRLRHAPRGWLLPDRLPGVARRAGVDLRRHRPLHRRLPVAGEAGSRCRPPPRSRRRVNLWTIWMAVLAVILVWAAYLVREVLLLIYISGLLAVGFSPIVRLIERQRALAGRDPALSALAGDPDPLPLHHRRADRHRLPDRAAAGRSGAATVGRAARACSIAPRPS